MPAFFSEDTTTSPPAQDRLHSPTALRISIRTLVTNEDHAPVLSEETPPPKREAFKVPPPPSLDELDEMLKDL